MPKYKLLIARFPYGRQEDPDSVDWVLKNSLWAERQPHLEVIHWRIDDTPITMGRNRCLEVAKKAGADFVLMLDSDMAPDLYLGLERSARPFLPTALEFMIAHKGPCAVGAPYCGPPPHENVYVFHWKNEASDHPDHHVDLELGQYSREQAAVMGGIQEAAALPTGLFLLDVRALAAVKPPHFYYEWAGDGDPCEKCGTPAVGLQAEKASTEDVTFTRDLSLAGVKVYCHWDAWAGHWKRKCVGKPRPYSVDLVSHKLRDAYARNWSTGERLIDVPEAGVKVP